MGDTRAQGVDVVVPIAAEDPAFEEAGYDVPRPLIEIDGRPMIKWATEPVEETVESPSFVFVVLQSHVDAHDIDDRLREWYGPNVSVVTLDGMTDGAAETALAAEPHVSDRDLLVMFGDQYVTADIGAAIGASDADGLVVTFESRDAAWSYAATDEDGFVERVAAKDQISSTALSGIYYFADGTDFLTAARRLIEKDVRTNGLFYVCSVYNELLDMSQQVETVPAGEMWSLGTPSDIHEFEEQVLTDDQ